MIHVEDLHKRYQQHTVLDGVSFQVPAGTTAAVLGPSGGGKSTLLRCLVGLERYDRGTVRVEDACVQGESEAGRARQLAAQAALRGRIGLVFQGFELFGNLDVLDNCTLAPMRARGLHRDEAEAQATRLLAQLGLEGKERAFPDHLSGGQRQRVAIARALAMGPRVLLYDEPTSALDPSLKHEVRETIRAVGATGVTQVVVTHDVSLAHDVAARVFLLERGRISAAEEGRGEVVGIGAR